MPTPEKITYAGWPNCYKLSNGNIELIVTADVGPRIIRLGFKDQTNLFCEVPEDAGKTGGDTFRMYGGHRFWHAPEEHPRTYYPDNNPVTVSQTDNYVRFTAPVETSTGLQKELDIYMSDNTNSVKVVHRMTNRNLWPIEFAPWALSVMRTDGTAVLPLPERKSHTEALLPTNALVLWAYTNLQDPRWHLGNRNILLQQQKGNTTPQKLGASVPDGWAAYIHKQTAFIKTFNYNPHARYPDYGSNVEVFTNEFMLELETLGPLSTVHPDSSVEHVEGWSLFEGVPPVKTSEDVEVALLPLIEKAKAHHEV